MVVQTETEASLPLEMIMNAHWMNLASLSRVQQDKENISINDYLVILLFGFFRDR